MHAAKPLQLCHVASFPSVSGASPLHPLAAPLAAIVPSSARPEPPHTPLFDLTCSLNLGLRPLMRAFTELCNQTKWTRQAVAVSQRAFIPTLQTRETNRLHPAQHA
eukprot:2918037-Rhodomonas_salina.2